MPEQPEPATAREFAARLTGIRSQMGAPVRRAFVMRSPGEAKSPMGALLSSASSGGGGRGGRTRLALVLSLLWVASAPPYTTSRSSRWWAEVIGLEDPGTKGARAVSTNFHELARRGFIRLEPGAAGYNPKVTLLNETPPHGDYSPPFADEDRGGYFRLSERLWTHGAIGKLDGPALAMLLILTYYYRPEVHERDGVWFSPNSFRERHGLSETTRNRGLETLVDAGVAHMKETFVDTMVDGRYRTFRRRIFRLDPLYRPPHPAAAPTATAPEQRQKAASAAADPWASYQPTNVARRDTGGGDPF